MQDVTQRSERGNDITRLASQVRAAGLLQKRPGYYARKITITVLLFAAGWVGFFLIGASWVTLVIAAYLGIMATQVAFIGHDAGHRQIFPKKKANIQVSLVLGNLLIGLSTGWWIDKHDRHHDKPNQIGLDPDIGVGALVHTKRQAADRSLFGRFLSRNQAYFFFPLLLMEGFNLHVSSIQAVLDGTVKPMRMRALESFLLLVHVSFVLTAVFTVLSPIQAVAFIALNQGIWGLYMGLSFAPNHKGMPYLEADTKQDFLRQQVLTSRNIRGGWLTDWLLGGLNYQIEHHLFPSMPRPSLRRSQQMIRRYCIEHDVQYTETSLWRSYALVLRHLRNVGADV